MAEQPSNGQLLEELEALSQTLYQSHVSSTARRTASLALPRTAMPPIPSSADGDDEEKPKSILKPLSRRMSMSPWRSRPKHDPPTSIDNNSLFSEEAATPEKKSIWNWKPMRALSHIGMQKISCLFSVEVVSVNGLPSSMNGLRLSVCVRKKETKDGAVHTMPSRVSQGAADFEETLFVKCHVYSSVAPVKFDPRPFLIYAFAVDASELDFGRSSVDLSRLIQESAAQGTRIRQWDTNFKLSGKAKGGELALKLGFQIMEKDGVFSDSIGKNRASMEMPKTYSPSFGRKQSKTSFSIPSPKMSGRMQVWTPSTQGGSARADTIQGFEELNLDEEPTPATTSSHKQEPAHEVESKEEDLDLPDFDVVDKGVEVQEKEEPNYATADEESSEVVKEVVHDRFHLTRLSELDSIAQQIKALESIMGEEKEDSEEAQSQRLDADEENVTREFLQLLEEEDEEGRFKHYELRISNDKAEDAADQANVYLPDLGKGLGCIVQTRNGGFLAAMNPLDVIMSRKDTPKLAMQISRPFVITSAGSGFELFQQMAAAGFEELSSEILDRMSIEELMDKTPEQIAFEGIASAIIHGRSKEGASSSAARTIAGLKNMASAMSQGRKERIATGIWNVDEEPLAVDELLPFSLQKMEAMAIDALKIQANIAEEEPPFDVSPAMNRNSSLDSAVPLDEWINTSSNQQVVTLAVVIQLHDPLRRYEAVGGAMIGLIQATREKISDDDKEFKVNSLHLGGMKVQRGQKRNAWDSEKQRLTAMQWLIAYGLGRGGGKKLKVQSTKGPDLMWSLSSRVMADMWLKPMRNPDVKFTK